MSLEVGGDWGVHEYTLWDEAMKEADEEETQCKCWETGKNRISEQELKKRKDSS